MATAKVHQPTRREAAKCLIRGDRLPAVAEHLYSQGFFDEALRVSLGRQLRSLREGRKPAALRTLEALVGRRHGFSCSDDEPGQKFGF